MIVRSASSGSSFSKCSRLRAVGKYQLVLVQLQPPDGARYRPAQAATMQINARRAMRPATS